MTDGGVADHGAGGGAREGRQGHPTDRHARRAWRIAGVGTLVGGPVLAAVAARSGGGGRAGLAFFLLAALLACAVAALYAVSTGALDAVRGRPVGRSRAVAAVVLSLLTLVLPVMVLGLLSS